MKISRLFQAKSSLTFRQLQRVDSFWNAYVIWQEHKAKCTVQISTHNTIIWLVWLNGLLLVYEQSGCGFASSCSHLNFRFRACFEQGIPWHSDSYRMWIHSGTRTWYDKNIQSINYILSLFFDIFNFIFKYLSNAKLSFWLVDFLHTNLKRENLSYVLKIASYKF